MSTMRHIGSRLAVFGLAVLFVVPSFVAAAGQPQMPAKTSDDLLLKIMEIHSQLVTNEVFLAQAKAIGTYLEAALQFDEPKKVKAYSTVLEIVSQIKNADVRPAIQKESQELADAKPSQAEPADNKTIYEPGSALLEVFNAVSIDKVPDVPTIRTYWQRDLAYKGDFLLPGREADVGLRSEDIPFSAGERRYDGGYVAKFAFYYEASYPGKYGFTVMHSPNNVCLLKIGDVDVVKAQPGETGQGVCSLEKGFHRVEFWIATKRQPYRRHDGGLSDFQVKVMNPDSFDTVPLRKDMMLLKKDAQKEGKPSRYNRKDFQGY